MASIVPSLLAGDITRLGEALDAVQSLGFQGIHIDVMDGHFRPQISVGQPVISSIRQATRLKMDVHLMVERPERFFEDFVKAGADSLVFHIEATQNVTLAINLARKLETRVGLALSPATQVEACYDVLEYLDTVLVETGIENFTPRSLYKVGALVKEREGRGLNFAVQTEGGIGAKEAVDLLAAGADILVVGSTIFQKGEDGEALRQLVRTMGSTSADAGRMARYPVC